MNKLFDKDMIESEIAAFIPRSERGFPPQVPLHEIVNAILYKFRTGVQWEFLPVVSLFEERR